MALCGFETAARAVTQPNRLHASLNKQTSKYAFGFHHGVWRCEHRVREQQQKQINDRSANAKHVIDLKAARAASILNTESSRKASTLSAFATAFEASPRSTHPSTASPHLHGGTSHYIRRHESLHTLPTAATQLNWLHKPPHTLEYNSTLPVPFGSTPSIRSAPFSAEYNRHAPSS